MIAVSNNTSNGDPIMTGKSDMFSDLRALGVELSPSKLRKTTLAELQAMLDAKHAEIAREQETRKAKRAASNNVVRLKPKGAPKPRAQRGVNLAPKPADQIKACKAGSKRAVIVDLLARPEGATADDLVQATGWASRSVAMSGLYWDVNKQLGYGVRTTFADDGTPRYHLERVMNRRYG